MYEEQLRSKRGKDRTSSSLALSDDIADPPQTREEVHVPQSTVVRSIFPSERFRWQKQTSAEETCFWGVGDVLLQSAFSPSISPACFRLLAGREGNASAQRGIKETSSSAYRYVTHDDFPLSQVMQASTD